MKFTPSKLNTFIFFKIPSAFWSGVRVKSITEDKCEATVKYRWFNQNPFNSMYFAVQAMAAEFTTGALVMLQVKKSGKSISILVANNKATFTKKATGRISFTCNQGVLIKETIQSAIDTMEGQTVWLTSIGLNEDGVQVSEMQFEWTVKVRK
jgi:phage terminase large subunit-like protein